MNVQSSKCLLKRAGAGEVGLPPAGTYLNDNDNLLEFRVPHSQTNPHPQGEPDLALFPGPMLPKQQLGVPDSTRQLWSKSKTAGFALLSWQHYRP